MIVYQCPECGTQLRISEEYAGKTGKCKSCGSAIVAPSNMELTEPKIDFKATKRLGWIFWLSAVFFPPLALTIAWRLQKDHEHRRGLLFGVSAWLVLVLIVGLLPDKEAPAMENAGANDERPNIAKSSEHTTRIILPDYQVLDEETSDTPGKAQVLQDILVSGEVNQSSLKALLVQLHGELSERRGFTYFTHPTVVGIYAYTSRDRANSGMGQWIAMLSFTPNSPDPSIHFNERELANFGRPEEIKFGLSEVAREEVWQQVVRAEDRASSEAETAYSTEFSGQNSDYIVQQLGRKRELENKLSERYEKEILDRTGLSIEQMRSISMEALEKNWAFPIAE